MQKGILVLLALGLVPAFGTGTRAAESPTPPGPWQRPPDLGQPAGRVVQVRTEQQLQAAVQGLKSNTTILIAPGTYKLTSTLHIHGGVKNVALRGAAGDRGKVVLRGRGMRNKNHGSVPHGILVSDAQDVLIANLSVGDVWYHPVTLQGPAGCQRVRLFNVRLFDAGEQFLKSNPDGKGGGVDGCVVEYCVFEFTDTARHNYTEGVDVHTGANWVIRNSLFRNIRGPKGDAKVGGAIDFWHGSRNTTVEGNLFVNCRMGIRLGFLNRKPQEGYHDHQGGVIRNNVVWRQPGAVEDPDTGIHVGDSPGTRVLHNTVVLNGTYDGAIEYRWSADVTVANNLTDGRVWKREESGGKEANNVRVTDMKLFVRPAAGDLHLAPGAAAVLGKVRRLADCLLDLDGDKRHERTEVGADEFSERR